MTANLFLRHALAFLLYVIVQVFFLKGVIVFGVAFCWLYVSFLLFLPFATDRALLLLIAFIFGLTIDMFYNTLGVNTAACLTMAFARKYVLRLYRPSGGYEPQQRPLLADMRLQWFASYTLTMLAIHHLILFWVEDLSLLNFGMFLLKVFGSLTFTFITILLFQYLFYRQ